MKKNKLLLATILLTSACYSPVTDIYMDLPPVERREENLTTTRVKKHYFNEHAQKKLESVDLYNGPALAAYVTVGFWGKFASFISGNGLETKVIIPQFMFRNQGVSVLNHELVHVLDYLDREGNEEFIDHKKFKKEYLKFLNDPTYKLESKYVSQKANDSSFLFFGIGELSEEIAYVAGYASVKPNSYPDYLKKELLGIFKKEILFPDTD